MSDGIHQILVGHFPTYVGYNLVALAINKPWLACTSNAERKLHLPCRAMVEVTGVDWLVGGLEYLGMGRTQRSQLTCP